MTKIKGITTLIVEIGINKPNKPTLLKIKSRKEFKPFKIDSGNCGTLGSKERIEIKRPDKAFNKPIIINS